MTELQCFTRRPVPTPPLVQHALQALELPPYALNQCRFDHAENMAQHHQIGQLFIYDV
ncbi:hypothetical protein [Thiocapsa rosea]|uniref:hypothetical protein n=1 Tax=Thiocapsa rosea TaxID=69360 RepID=UPI001FE8ABB1|nr:hypothetical protein [Thiocapsa rosea]